MTANRHRLPAFMHPSRNPIVALSDHGSLDRPLFIPGTTVDLIRNSRGRLSAPEPAVGLLFEAFEPPMLAESSPLLGGRRTRPLGRAGLGTGRRPAGFPADGEILQEPQQAIGTGGYRGLEQVRG